MAASYTIVNGNRYSWASVSIKLGGQTFTGFTEISYSNNLEPGDVYVEGRVSKDGRTRGQNKPTASITFLKHV
jgi:acyl-coenzyme A thioesterase PaaI-like protein